MRTVLSRLIHSTPSISRLNATAVSISGRNLCTDSNKVDEPFKVEEAETVNVPPPPTEKVFYQHNRLISFMGGFGSNIKAIRAASDQGVKRFVYISAAECGVVNDLLQGYNIGKRAAETELLNRFPFGGVILRPGFLYGPGFFYGPRSVASPLEMVLQVAKPSNQIPLVGPLLTPPVSVTAVAKVAVTAATATDPVFPPGIIDAYGIRRLLSE